MSREDNRTASKRHHHLVVFGVLAGVVVGAAITFTIITLLATNQRHDASSTTQTTISTSSSTRQRSTSSSKVQSPTTNSANDQNTTKADSTYTVTDVSHYDYLNGVYDSVSTKGATLDFDDETLDTFDTGSNEILYHFTKVMHHPDGSLVINLQGNVSRSDPNDTTKTISVPNYLSLLLAPAGITIKKNWQSNDAVTDNTDNSVARFAIANSNDGGQTFQMADAYQAFADNNNVSTLN